MWQTVRAANRWVLGGAVYASALRVLRDTTSAEDVAQDVFTILWRRRAEPRIGELWTWLAGVTVNSAASAVVRRSPLPPTTMGGPPACAGLGFDLARSNEANLPSYEGSASVHNERSAAT